MLITKSQIVLSFLMMLLFFTIFLRNIKLEKLMKFLRHLGIHIIFFSLRLFFVFWCVMVIGIFFPSGEMTVTEFIGIFMVSIIFYLTKCDVEFIGRFIRKWQFKASVHCVYALIWIGVLSNYYSSQSYEKGIWLMFASLVIAPISEILHSLLLLLIYSLYPDVPKIRIGTPMSYLDSIFRVVLSFIVLELLLRFAKYKLSNTAAEDDGNHGTTR